MGGSERLCPACGAALRASSLSGVSAHVCAQCNGTLLAQIDMIRLLDAMSVELLKDFDPDTHLDPVSNKAATITCPACARAMARDDYCSAGLVHFDRCEPCHLLWLGADELGTMTLMWARMERRLERTHNASEAALAEAADFTSKLLVGRATRRILMRFL